MVSDRLITGKDYSDLVHPISRPSTKNRVPHASTKPAELVAGSNASREKRQAMAGFQRSSDHVTAEFTAADWVTAATAADLAQDTNVRNCGLCGLPSNSSAFSVVPLTMHIEARG
jgi:hypothetical protein